MIAVLELATVRCADAQVRFDSLGTMFDVCLRAGALTSDDMKHLGRLGWCVQSMEASVTIFRPFEREPLGRADASDVEVSRFALRTNVLRAQMFLASYEAEHGEEESST